MDNSISTSTVNPSTATSSFNFKIVAITEGIIIIFFILTVITGWIYFSHKTSASTSNTSNKEKVQVNYQNPFDAIWSAITNQINGAQGYENPFTK